MRKLLLLGCLSAGLLAVGIVVLLQTVGVEQELIRRAIAAHGGDQAIRRIKAGRLRGDETRFRYGGEQAFVWEETFQLSDQLRFAFWPKLPPSPTKIYLSGPKQWFGRKDDESFQPLEAGAPPELYIQPLIQLLAIHDQNLTLMLIDDAEVRFRPASGVLVDSPNWGKVTFYFDQGSGLLVKLKKEPEKPEAGVPVEKVFSQHQRFGDLLLPTRITEYILGAKQRELTVNQVEFLARVEPDTFLKPESGS